MATIRFMVTIFIINAFFCMGVSHAQFVRQNTSDDKIFLHMPAIEGHNDSFKISAPLTQWSASSSNENIVRNHIVMIALSAVPTDITSLATYIEYYQTWCHERGCLGIIKVEDQESMGIDAVYLLARLYQERPRSSCAATNTCVPFVLVKFQGARKLAELLDASTPSSLIVTIDSNTVNIASIHMLSWWSILLVSIVQLSVLIVVLYGTYKIMSYVCKDNHRVPFKSFMILISNMVSSVMQGYFIIGFVWPSVFAFDEFTSLILLFGAYAWSCIGMSFLCAIFYVTYVDCCFMMGEREPFLVKVVYRTSIVIAIGVALLDLSVWVYSSIVGRTNLIVANISGIVYAIVGITQTTIFVRHGGKVVRTLLANKKQISLKTKRARETLAFARRVRRTGIALVCSMIFGMISGGLQAIGVAFTTTIGLCFLWVHFLLGNLLSILQISTVRPRKPIKLPCLKLFGLDSDDLNDADTNQQISSVTHQTETGGELNQKSKTFGRTSR